MSTRNLLWSGDTDDILSTIDDLRRQGVGSILELPQIIVCGDQSAGKSAVLNAISSLKFPTKDGLCTRFATEVVMRPELEQEPEQEHRQRVTVSIVPGSGRSDTEKASLRGFEREDVSMDDIDQLIEKAGKAMNIDPRDPNSERFSDDVLRFEITGPQQPRLTLVDLPGLFHASSIDQTADDAECVQRLVQNYMKNKRSIILAVISAQSDFALQAVTEYSKEADEHGLRTLGILTKPDKLDVGSESESKFLALVNNKLLPLHLGWHVLVNRNHDQTHYSQIERDDNEREFLSRGKWADLVPQWKGIFELNSRLTGILRQRILEALPELIEDAEREIAQCKLNLLELGPSRSNPYEQRQYLLQAAQTFNTTMRASINGSYDDTFFATSDADVSAQKRLRAVVQNTLTDFAETMDSEGSKNVIVADSSTTESATATSLGSRKITLYELENEVMVLMNKGRGRELPGLYDPMIVRELFKTQSEPWVELARRYSLKIFESASVNVSLVLEHATDEDTKIQLEQRLIKPSLERLQKSVDEMIRRILKPHRDCHPITYNRILVDRVQASKCSFARKVLRLRRDQLEQLGKNPVDISLQWAIEQPFNVSARELTRFAASEAIEVMQAYYQVAKDNFIHNLSTLAIEECLISQLPDLLTPDRIMDLGDEEIGFMAAETESVQWKRELNELRLNQCQLASEQLRKLRSKYTHPGERVSIAHPSLIPAHDMPKSWAIDGSTRSTPSTDGPSDSGVRGCRSGTETPDPVLR